MIIRAHVIACLLFTSFSSVQAQLPSMDRGDSSDCVNVSDCSANGILLGQLANGLESAFGPLQSFSHATGEDSLGEFPYRDEFYTAIRVGVVRGKVDRIRLNSPGVHLACGVAVGQSFVEVVRRLRILSLPSLDRHGRLFLQLCPWSVVNDGKESTFRGLLILEFDKAKILVTIDLSIPRW